MKVGDWLTDARSRLAEATTTGFAAGVSRGTGELQEDCSPRLDAELILAHVLGRNRTWLYTWPDADVIAADVLRADALLRRRVAGKPLAYLTGTREFWSLPFDVSAAVLVPRPETELLVEQALTIIQEQETGLQQKPGLIVELGTGSGAIAVALATECHWPIVATDRSTAALQVARRNAERLAPGRVSFVQGHWLDAIADDCARLIISNPPYLAVDDPHLRGTALAHEPTIALVAADDGLADIREIILQCGRVAGEGCIVMLEHGHEQGRTVRQVMHAAGFEEVATLSDLAGNERVTQGMC